MDDHEPPSLKAFIIYIVVIGLLILIAVIFTPKTNNTCVPSYDRSGEPIGEC